MHFMCLMSFSCTSGAAGGGKGRAAKPGGVSAHTPTPQRGKLCLALWAPLAAPRLERARNDNGNRWGAPAASKGSFATLKRPRDGAGSALALSWLSLPALTGWSHCHFPKTQQWLRCQPCHSSEGLGEPPRPCTLTEHSEKSQREPGRSRRGAGNGNWEREQLP